MRSLHGDGSSADAVPALSIVVHLSRRARSFRASQLRRTSSFEQPRPVCLRLPMPLVRLAEATLNQALTRADGPKGSFLGRVQSHGDTAWPSSGSVSCPWPTLFQLRAQLEREGAANLAFPSGNDAGKSTNPTLDGKSVCRPRSTNFSKTRAPL